MGQRPISKVYASVETRKGLVRVVLRDNMGGLIEDCEEPTKEARKNHRDCGAAVLHYGDFELFEPQGLVLHKEEDQVLFQLPRVELVLDAVLCREVHSLLGYQLRDL